MASAAARRGKFGNLPAASTSLQATIISIATSLRDANNSAIMDAWKNGGVWHGKPVTDAIMLAYWRDQLNGLDKTDPLYTTYENTILQSEYAIAEGKATV